MSKTITINFQGRDYTLEYNRDTVAAMEATGFVADDLFTRPATMIPMLFYGAFRIHHKGLKRKDVDNIYAKLENRSELISALTEMYRDTVTSFLVDNNEDEDEGNATWTMSE